jgi:phage gp29-like protein
MGLLSRVGGAIASFFTSPAAPAIVAGYLPEPKPELARGAPLPPRIEIVTTQAKTDYFESYAGFKLTPERVAWIYRQADAGQPALMLDIMRNVVLGDGHTRGLFEQRMDEVAAQPWTLRPGDDRAESAAIAEAMLEPLSELAMDDLIEHLMLAGFFGYSYGELAWQTRADGLQVPVEVVCVPHNRFIFDLDTWTPRLTSDANPYPGEPLESRPGSSWIRAESKRWPKQTQAGILRTVVYWAVFKRMSVRDWLIFAEKFGIPMIVGKYGDNTGEPARKALKDAIAALGTEGRAILEHDMIIDVVTQALRSGNGDHLHQGITQLCNSEISKAINASTLTTETGGPGSFALGEVHAAQKHKLSLADARRVGKAVRRDLLTEFVRRNRTRFPAGIAPHLHVHVQKLSLLQDAQTVKTLGEAGLKLSARHQREYFNQPAPSGPDDELKPPEKNADPFAKDSGRPPGDAA